MHDSVNSTVEMLIQNVIYSESSIEKVLQNKILHQAKSLNENIKLIRFDLQKSYGLQIDTYGLIYLASISNYISDKKDALVVSAWIAYSIKKLAMVNPEQIISNQISVQLLKNLPLLSKQMLILLWSMSIETYCFDKLEYKSSLFYTTYL